MVEVPLESTTAWFLLMIFPLIFCPAAPLLEGLACLEPGCAAVLGAAGLGQMLATGVMSTAIRPLCDSPAAGV